MRMSHNSHSPLAHHSVTADVVSPLQDLLYSAQNAWLVHRKAFADRRAVARAEAELSALDDLLLADMGISRSTIHAAVTGNL